MPEGPVFGIDRPFARAELVLTKQFRTEELIGREVEQEIKDKVTKESPLAHSVRVNILDEKDIDSLPTGTDYQSGIKIEVVPSNTVGGIINRLSVTKVQIIDELLKDTVSDTVPTSQPTTQIHIEAR